MKQEFFSYIGPSDSLANYSRSYKLVFLKSLLASMDNTGKATAFNVASKFKEFYFNRKRLGKIPDANVDNRIANPDSSSTKDVLNVIKDNPFNAMSGQGFISLKKIEDEEYFSFNPQLVSELTQQDLSDLNYILDKKLNLYFSRIDGEGSLVDLNMLFNRMLDEYYTSRTSQPFAGNPIGELFRKKSVDTIYSLPFIEQRIHLVKGSVGQGNWAMYPWVCIFDRRITTSAQDGVYIVYLLSEDGERLFLTLNQGCTEILKNNRKRDAISILQKTASQVRSKITSNRFIAQSDIKLGNEFYEHGCIFYKQYSKGSVPSNDELVADLKEMVDLYRQYQENATVEPVDIQPVINEPIGESMKLNISNEIIAELNISDEITRISEYIAGKGFSYEKGLIENFYLCLKSKPFVILAGTSGTGKTRLVKLFAEAIGATSENGRYKLVSVRPDWSDSTDLFGHVDLNGRFITGAITSFIKLAILDQSKPYFLCLDEMNLARVEFQIMVFSVFCNKEHSA